VSIGGSAYMIKDGVASYYADPGGLVAVLHSGEAQYKIATQLEKLGLNFVLQREIYDLQGDSTGYAKFIGAATGRLGGNLLLGAGTGVAVNASTKLIIPAASKLINATKLAVNGYAQNQRHLAAAGMLAVDDVKYLNNAKELLTIPYANVSKSTSILERFAAKGGIEAANGLKITGFTSHGVDRAIGSIGRSGVKPDAILDALKNPLKINNVVTDQLGRQSQRFIGQFGEVVVNPQTGRIISVNPTSTSKAAKLLKQLGQ
jgi:hypothetical protein